ncbi:hypothetical protein PM8797T_15356 [Gimesia maris DSM 8797]|nr:hypothetical protein PM8797T_15356 [Gimesia maris DSM 8797]
MPPNQATPYSGTLKLLQITRFTVIIITFELPITFQQFGYLFRSKVSRLSVFFF